MSNVAVAERPASVTVAPGVTVTAAMTPTERFNAIAKAAGAPTIAPTIAAPQFHTPATLQRFAQGDAEARSAAPAVQREDGTAVAAPHAGMVAPSPEELAAGNSGDPLAAFDAEMRAKGIQRPLEEQQAEAERFQVDDRTGIRVDTHALERCHALFRAITDPKEREAARAEYESVLSEIYAGRLTLSEMEDAPGGEQPRDARGRYTPSQPAAAPTYTPEQWAEGHASVTTADGWIPLERINQAGLSGYTLPRLVEGQTYHRSIFADLARARAAGVTQAQVAAYIREGMRAEGFNV